MTDLDFARERAASLDGAWGSKVSWYEYWKAIRP